MYRKRSHVCGAYLSSATLEHMDALKIQGLNSGIKFCKATFPSNTFSDSNYRMSKLAFTKPYESRQSLISHFSDSKSQSMFLQSPYEEHYPDWFENMHTEIPFAYSGYSINLADYYPGTYGSSIVRNSRFLLAGSQDELNGYTTVARADAIVQLTGNPLLFELRKMINQNKNRPKKPMRILWAPHWTTSWQDSTEGLARWDIALEAIHTFANMNLDKEIVFRPHPLLRAAIEAELGKEKILKHRESIKTQQSEYFMVFVAQLREFLQLKNVKTSKNTMLQDVYQSDLLVTEGLSIIAYWATTGKPILVLRDDRSPKFNAEGEELLTTVDQTNLVAEALSWLDLHSTSRKINKARVDLSHNIHPTFDKSPLELIHQYM
jgi:hypothetical protein